MPNDPYISATGVQACPPASRQALISGIPWSFWRPASESNTLQMQNSP